MTRSTCESRMVAVGRRDAAGHVISEINGALCGIGYTVPGQSWTYWHLGPGPGPEYLDDQGGHDWAHKTGRAIAAYGTARPEPWPPILWGPAAVTVVSGAP